MTKKSAAPLMGKADGFCDIDGPEDNDAEPQSKPPLGTRVPRFRFRAFLTKLSGPSRQEIRRNVELGTRPFLHFGREKPVLGTCTKIQNLGGKNRISCQEITRVAYY